MNENSVITNKMPSVVLILIIVLSSFAALGPTQNVKALGTESVNFVDTAFDLHYGIGEDILFSFTVAGADDELNYEASWRVCSLVNDLAADYSDWIDGDCIESSVSDPGGANSMVIGGDYIVPAGVSDGYLLIATMPGTTSFDDGSGGILSVDTLPTGSYTIASMMTVSGVTVATANSTLFSIGSNAKVLVDLARSGDILGGMDYSFDWKATDMHRMGSVEYGFEWEMLDDSVPPVAVDSGSVMIGSTPGCLWNTYTHPCGTFPSYHGWEVGPVITGLASGDYTLHAWLTRDGVADDALSADYTHDFTVSTATITGDETVVVTNNGASSWIAVGVDWPFTIGLSNLYDDPGVTTYDLEWRVCKIIDYGFSTTLALSDWVDGDCTVATVSDPTSGNVMDVGGVETVDNSAATSSVVISSFEPCTINSIDLDCLSEGEYVISAMLGVNGISLDSNNSTIFSVDSKSNLNLYYNRSGNIINGHEFSWSAYIDGNHHHGSVDYDLEWELFDVTDPGVPVANGFENVGSWRGGDWGGSAWVYPDAIPGSSLGPGDYQLDVWIEMECGGGCGPDPSPNAEASHTFTVIDDDLTGTEALDFTINSLHYDIGEDVPFTVDISDLSTDADTDYSIEWRVCGIITSQFHSGPYENSNINYYQGFYHDNEDWTDRDCYPIWVNSNPLGESTVVDNTASTSSLSDTMDGTITSGTSIYDSLGIGEYVLSAVLSVSGAIVASANSTLFSVGSWAEVVVGLERSGNILAGMDYNFDLDADYLHFLGSVDYEIWWVVRNDVTGVPAGAGYYSIGTMTEHTSLGGTGTIPSNMMSYGDYTLYVWLERDGVADESSVAEFEHGFRVVNPALNTLATVDITIDMTTDGWAQAVISTYDLDSGQLFTIDWEVKDIMNTAVDSGTDEWIAPPDTHSISLDFNHISNGQYCLSVLLYAGNTLVHTDNECWTQASTADADSDGVLDADDMCPYDPVVANDANGDGCEDVDDTDGDGMPDDWENFYNTDPYTDDGASDLDGDGVSNLDEFTGGTNPASSDTDEDFVNDGVDVCPLVWGDMANGCLTPINLPPICDIYFSLEMNGMVISGSAAIPAIPPMIPGGIGPQEIQVPAGTYYIIAVCTDPEGDMVTVTINGVTIGPAATATVGAVVNITENVEATVDVTVTWTDGVNTLTGAISITVSGGTNFDSDADGDGYTPGFTAALGVMSLLGAAIAIRRRRL
jgi:hypothetical protein